MTSFPDLSFRIDLWLLGIRFERNYKRKGKTMLRKHSGYVKAKQFNRTENVVRAVKQYLRNVVNFAEAQQIVPRSPREVALTEQLRECIEKGKVHKRYEYGVKAWFVTASRTNRVLGAMAQPGNPYDGKTLTQVLAQAEKLCGVKVEHAYCDLCYRGNDYKGDCAIGP